MLTCPCGKEITIETEYGVRVYKHIESDKYCQRMNKFTVDMTDLVGDMIVKAFKEKRFDDFVAYCHDVPPVCRSQLYRFISNKKDSEQETIAIFRALFSDEMPQSVKFDIAQEMIKVFGHDRFKMAVQNSGISQSVIMRAYSNSNESSKSDESRNGVGELLRNTRGIDIATIKPNAMRKVKAEEIMSAVDQAATQFISSSTSRRDKARKALDEELARCDW